MRKRQFMYNNSQSYFITSQVLLLLIQLTKGNANIQKIVAFENAFDRIFDVIAQEGNVEGGIVVEDCLLLMLNLLRGNISNQNFFKEGMSKVLRTYVDYERNVNNTMLLSSVILGSYIQKLTPMFQISSEHDDNPLSTWSPQKVSNVHCMVQVIRALVAPSGPAQVISQIYKCATYKSRFFYTISCVFVKAISNCQRIMRACGLLQALCNILMASGVPADVLTETINTVAEVIRGNSSNQEFLAEVMAPSNPPRYLHVISRISNVIDSSH